MSHPANDNFSLHDDEELSLHDDASLDGSVPATNKGDAPAKPPQIITTNTLSNIKLPGSSSSHTEEQFADEKKGKARTLLLMAVPKESISTFSMAWMSQRDLGSHQDTVLVMKDAKSHVIEVTSSRVGQSISHDNENEEGILDTLSIDD
ncbi:hypothetical protein Tco_0716787 [Tanacetum coccineum]